MRSAGASRARKLLAKPEHSPSVEDGDRTVFRWHLTREEERVVAAILSALRRIQHGSVQLVVQDRRVVQIDTVEKTRLSR